ncbi:MAG: aldehyde dehydrogenase (NADP(+)) [Acidobacteria bacterium]|nr:aldehyde dehydrogenase (NADP(+)) [Acidobacteriota bacterium]
MTLHGQNFVGGHLRASSGGTSHAVSPLTSTPLDGTFHQATQADVDDALEAAEAAFGVFREASGTDRAVFLERVADEILALGDALIRRAHEETGLPEARLVGERGRTVGQLRMFAGVAREGSWVDARIDTAIPDRQPAPKPDLRRMLISIGPVIVFGSSNFPFAFSVAGGDTASALATGNPVIVKAHSGHPGTSELVATAIGRAAAACGLPPGVFSMLHGSGKVIGTALVRHPLARAVGFTGSFAAGRALFDAASARPHPIPVFAEMSSLNPVFVLPEALQQRGRRIAEGLRTSVTMGVGQFCTKPGLVFGLQDDAFAAFQQDVASLVRDVPPATMLHAGIYESFQQNLSHVLGAGVETMARSAIAPNRTETHAEAVVARTTAAHFLATGALAEEVFGPFTLLVAGANLEELELVASRMSGQLTATVHGTPDDLARARTLLRILEQRVGRLIVNGFPTGVEVCPSMNHGGPYPATTDVRFTSVGTAALLRFVRPICYQDFPAPLLPDPLKDGNPLGIQRMVDGQLGRH